MDNTGATMHVLLLTADPSLVATFTDLSKELGIEAESSGDSQEVSEQVNRGKYEGIVLDFDTVADASPVIATVRESRSNKNAIVFAVATLRDKSEQALQERAHFLIRRPIDTRTIRQTLHAAYDLMRSERRRYLRCAANLRVRLATISGAHLDCSTINVSSNGMAITTPIPLKLAEALDIALELPDGFTVGATGTVIWDDKHGKSGLRFHCSTPKMRQKLDSWLDSRASERAAGEK
jgi:DNA-binding response OmpR family regulator